MCAEIVAWLFGLGLAVNAALFVPQAAAIWRSRNAQGVSLLSFAGFDLMQLVGMLHGYFQRDWTIFLGMLASLITAGSVTLLALRYRGGPCAASSDEPGYCGNTNE